MDLHRTSGKQGVYTLRPKVRSSLLTWEPLATSSRFSE
jgi:hypothetical protein